MPRHRQMLSILLTTGMVFLVFDGLAAQQASPAAKTSEATLQPPGSAAVPGGSLPDSPGSVFFSFSAPQNGALSRSFPPCPPVAPPHFAGPPPPPAAPSGAPCPVPPDPYKRFLDTTAPLPLTPRQKGFLAIRDIVDPFNILTIVGNSAVTIGVDSHSAYGPGLRGFGKNVGVSFLQDATGEVIGTFAVCSLFHEDPHYHRMPQATPVRRVVHAISRAVVAQHDDGHLMPNYENLITFPASAEISNLYVPGIHGNLPSTVVRVITGLATEPIGNLITEFLPDFAKRVHIRVVFVQQIINQMASGEPI